MTTDCLPSCGSNDTSSSTGAFPMQGILQPWCTVPLLGLGGHFAFTRVAGGLDNRCQLLLDTGSFCERSGAVNQFVEGRCINCTVSSGSSD